MPPSFHNLCFSFRMCLKDMTTVHFSFGFIQALFIIISMYFVICMSFFFSFNFSFVSNTLTAIALYFEHFFSPLNRNFL